MTAMTPAEKRIAKQLGVTPAGLKFLASLKATGAASQRGNEADRLFQAGFIVPNSEVPQGHGRVNTDWTRRWFVITDTGREVVCRARAMGW